MNIVITGATKGIGRAVAYRFAAAGFDLAICSRNEDELYVMREDIEKQHKVHVYAGVCDVSMKEEITAFGETVARYFKKVDVLVNNAGIFRPGQVHKEDEGQLERMIETNVYSAYHLTRILLKNMIPHRSGHIFNMCSTASIIPYINGGSYCISKFALLGFSKVLREEMKEHGIKVTAILPGATLTASWSGTELPEDRFMKPEDIADAIWAAYQLSPSANVEELLIRPLSGDV